MAKFIYLNVSPQREHKNDCVTRAMSLASGLKYSTIRKKLFHTKELLECDSPYCPTCYSFLVQQVLGGVPKNCDGMTIGEFADFHPNGTYLIRIDGHLTTLIDGNLYDIFDCRNRLCHIAWKVHEN